jgi:hypothetical protein
MGADSPPPEAAPTGTTRANDREKKRQKNRREVSTGARRNMLLAL